jgi:hypothetical protein
MATNTCMSRITYQSEEERKLQPFYALRNDFAYEMYYRGKCEFYTNVVQSSDVDNGCRLWIDHAAAQEFIDWVVATAPTYNVTIASTAIEDLVQ